MYVYLRFGCPEPLPDKQIAPHFLFVEWTSGAVVNGLRTMNVARQAANRERRRYVTPHEDLYSISIEHSILTLSRDGDNETTSEEELF